MTRRGRGTDVRSGSGKFGRALVKHSLLTVSVLLVLCCGAALASGDDSPGVEPGGTALDAPPSEPTSLELDDKRTATSQTFLLPSGAMETRLYGSPVNYQDPQGDWKPIDEGFEELDNGRLTNGPNSFDISLPERLGEDPVRLGIDGAWVTTELLGAEPQAVQPEDATATYESVGNGAEFEFANLADGLKEEIVIAGPSQPSTFHFELDASNGLTPVMRDDGSVQFRDANGQGVVTLPAPVMSDSAEPAPATSRDIHYTLGPEVEGHWKLTVEADRDWLTQPDRSWPVRLDPTMTISSNLDCIIGGSKGQTGWIDCSAWGRKVDLVNYTPSIESSKDGWQRGLLYLETSDLPANATVSSATFNIYSAEAALNTSGAELLKTSKPWTWQASWSQYDGPTKLWTTEGGDTSESLGQVLTSQRGSQAGWWQFTLPAKTVEGEAAKAADLGTLLKLIDDKSRVCGPTSCTQRSIAFSSSAATDATKRPYLSVVYTVPTAPTVAAKAATLVKGTTATLNAGVNPNGASTTYQFEYGTTTAYGKVAPATGKAIGSGKTEVAVAEPLTGLSPATIYHFRVSATNSLGKILGEDKVFTTLKLPTATTEEATGVKVTEATLRASINPNGSLTKYQFEYGPTTSYGSYSPLVPEGMGSGSSGSSPVAVTRPIGNLAEASTYHFRVAAYSEAGVVYGADKALTTQDPPQTTITSPQPSYTSRELSSVTFSSDQSGSTFKCALDEGEKPTKACSSPYAIPSTLKDGLHTFVVMAVSASGIEDLTPAKYRFNPAIYPPAPSTSKLVTPEEGERSAKFYTLKAAWGEAPPTGGVTGVTFQAKFYTWDEFRTIPGKYLTDASGQQVTWPIAAKSNPGETSPVFLDMERYANNEVTPPWGVIANYPEEELRFRAVFDGGDSAAGASEPVTVDFDRDWGNPSEAVETIGPASVDLTTGKFTLSRTDVSIPVPGFEANLEFTRVYNSAFGKGGRAKTNDFDGVWEPSVPVDAAYEGQAWQAVVVRHENGIPAVYEEECEAGVCEKWEVEEAIPPADWVEVVDNEGGGISFEIVGTSYVAPDYAKEFKLTKSGSTFTLVEPSGTQTSFVQNLQPFTNEYRADTISWQASPKSARLVYSFTGSRHRLSKIIAPSAPGVECPVETAQEKVGCRTLILAYQDCFCGGTSHIREDRLASITYYNATGTNSQVVAKYEYDETGSLIAEWDPRITPELKETYTYGSGSTGQLLTLTPPGQSKWEFGYDASPYYMANRLKTVSRASLVESAPVATTTLVYNVPISGSTAPYDMSAVEVARWGQTDYPVYATAIFGPDQVPSESPSDYSHASVRYMDADGYQVNSASAAPPGVVGSVISTTETDSHGNVVRSLSAQNRLLALAVGVGSAVRSHQLDTQMTYSADGTEMVESLGPLHSVRLESGVAKDARARTVIEYDKEPNGTSTPAPPAGTPWPHLPTKETTTAMSGGFDYEPSVSETRYDWTLRKPTDTIIDPAGLNLRTHISYDPTTGQVTERTLPGKLTDGSEAHTTKTVYYSKEGSGPCGNNGKWAGLPCEVKPGAQPGTSGQPEILITKFKEYSPLGQPEEIVESPGGSETNIRKTKIKYDSAGRTIEKSQTGGGVEFPPTQIGYYPLTGLPKEQKFNCVSGKCLGGDAQAVTTTYDTLGRVEKYTDADGITSETTYDFMGRTVTTNDGKGSQIATYDQATGFLTELQDSAAGTFTATYNADGAITERGLPNGLVAKTTYDETGVPTHLSYVKTTMCSTGCTWLDFGAERSINGQVLAQSSNLSSQVYSYDKAGRLTRALDTSAGGSCATRSYSFDSDSNRTKLVTRGPGLGGACDTTSAGTTQNYSYDAADRLLETGLSYDNFGRITSLPTSYAGGGGALTTTYFSNDMVASQSQGGITNTFQLDASGRQSQRIQGGGLEGTEIFHYADGYDSPAWTIRGSAWSRSIVGIDGGLTGVQDSVLGTTLQLTNLHGDVVATASLSQSATKPTATFEFDEFGNPKQAGSRRFGWLGSTQRRTELPSGIIQMGVRSYVPAIGRFISMDPVSGGSANTYDYANADPVNGSDVSGMASERAAKRRGRDLKRLRHIENRANREITRAARSSATPRQATVKMIAAVRQTFQRAASIFHRHSSWAPACHSSYNQTMQSNAEVRPVDRFHRAISACSTAIQDVAENEYQREFNEGIDEVENEIEKYT